MRRAPDSCRPEYRATITRNRLVVVGWGPWLWASGPPPELRGRLAGDGVALADLTVIRDPRGLAHELVVEMLCGDGPESRAALVRWAPTVGYHRVWLPDEVVDFGDKALVGGTARTRCRNCRERFAADDPDFWVTVRGMGAFPVACPLCGGDLPQWSVRGRGSSYAPPTASDPALVPDTTRR